MYNSPGAEGPRDQDAERRQVTRSKKQRVEKTEISQEEREADLRKPSSSVKKLGLCPERNEKLPESFKLGKAGKSFAF